MTEAVPSPGPASAATATDEQLVDRIRAGDVALYELLMRRHNRAVYRAVRALLRDEDEVEDAMQQAWVSAYQRLDQYRGEARFGTWLVAVALNEARGRLRRAKLRAVADEAGPTPPRAASPESEVGMREVVGLVERAVERLPERQRTVFLLREVEGLGTADTAYALGVSEDVVKTRLHRARLLLRARLAADVGRAAPFAFEFDARRCDRVVAAVRARLAIE